MITPKELMDRLFSDSPKFHELDEDEVSRAAKVGFRLVPGAVSHAVSRKVLEWISERVTSEMTTLETGSGYTTVLFASLSKRHYVCTGSLGEKERILAYLGKLGINSDHITFIVGSTDRTLPSLDVAGGIDFAYIDGCHGYPFPALDWHYVDLMTNVGGVIGMDNAELRPVEDHCRFLIENGNYVQIGKVTDGDVVALYFRKLSSEQREWIDQAYSRKIPIKMRLKIMTSALLDQFGILNAVTKAFKR